MSKLVEDSGSEVKKQMREVLSLGGAPDGEGLKDEDGSLAFY
jgi:hypothetical protein